MTESRKFVLKQSALVLLGVMVCVAAMIGVFAMIGKFSWPVVLGGLVGGLISSGNFFFMAVSAELAADKAEQDNVQGGKALMQTSYTVRLIAMAVILFACAKSGWFNLFALVLPLVFVRPVLSLLEFFRKSGEAKV